MAYTAQFSQEDLKPAVTDIIVGFIATYAEQISLIALVAVMVFLAKNIDKLLDAITGVFTRA